MEKTTATTFGKALNTINLDSKARDKPFFLKKYAKEALLYFFAFSCGRICLFQMMNPLGIALLSTCFLEGYSFYVVAGAATLGFLTMTVPIGVAKYLLCILLCVMMNFVMGSRMKKLSLLQKSTLGAGFITLSGMFYAMGNGMSQYLTFVAVMEGIMVFSLTFVFSKGIKVMKGSLKRKIMTSEEIISLSLVFGSAVAGVAQVSIFKIPLLLVLSTFIILIAGFRGGAGIGAAAGVLFGFILLISGSATVTLFLILSITGLLCGALNSLGRIVTCLSYLLGTAVIAFYLDSSYLTQSTVIAILIGSVLFLLMPKKVFAFINTYACYETEFNEDEYFIRLKDMMKEKLTNFSTAFSTLSKTFSVISEKTTTLNQKDVARLIDDVAAKVCSGCGLRSYCWEKDFYNTYQTIFSALSSSEKKGQVFKKDISGEFIKSCVNIDYFLDVTNRTFDRYKTDVMWENKLGESRELVSQQLGAVAEIIGSIAKDIDFKAVFNQSFEKELSARLDKAKWTTSRVSVVENENGSYEVFLFLLTGFGKNLGEVVNLTSEVLGKKMKKASVEFKDECCVIKLVEESMLRLSTGVASIAKKNSDISGDSYSFLELKDGCSLMALSDGMGSGRKANKESVTTIELLEQFIECGFDKELALKIINSVLVLKSSEETFSTLDICSVNLYTGMAEFIKIGAASAYVLRGNDVRAVRSYTLPVGVMKNIDIEKTNIQLKPDDIVLLMTDGVGDIVEQNKKGELWIEKIFADFKSNNPQDVAEYVMIQAKKESNEIRDDMTVLAARLWEK